MIYTIPLGKHKSRYFPSFLFKNQLSFDWEFIDDSVFYLPKKKENWDDVNKIYGFSDSFFHHIHSLRLGYRFNTKEEIHELVFYQYNNKKRIITVIGNLEDYFRKNNYSTIFIKRNHYEIFINGKKYYIPRTSHWWGPRYLLFPFFGGDETAPKDIRIKISKK